MIEWTEGARKALDVYADKVRARLVGAGADPEEVFADLREHIEQSALDRGVALLTASDVTQMLDGMGEPDAASEPVSAEKPVARRPRSITIPTLHLWLGGVILPVLAIAVQVTTGVCSAVLEPIPSFLHVLFIGSVPAASVLGLRALAYGITPHASRIMRLIAFGMGVSLVYTLLFAPLLPLSVILLPLGVGALGLSPLLALVSLAGVRRRLARAGVPTPRHALLRGMAVAVLALWIGELPAFVTSAGLHMADSLDTGTSHAGLWLLRRFGHEPTLRSAAQRTTFEDGARDASLLLFPARILDPLGSQTARTLYYRATGDGIDGKPRVERFGRVFDLNLTRRDWDSDRGSDRVGGVLRNLSLAVSRMDVHVKPSDSLAYIEWTQEFQNDGTESKESRAQWRLPEGSVVSRVTLWINGEPREAAFGSTSRVRAAYQEVAVAQQRDPLLVSWSGPNTVLVQAFPVPAGQRMRIRIGVTAPVQLSTEGHAELALPHVVESNYEVGAGLRHRVWIESSAEVRADLAELEPLRTAKGFVLRGPVEDRSLTQLSLGIDGVRTDDVRVVDAPPLGACPKGAACRRTAEVIEQRWVQREDAAPRHLAVVIDGSAALDAHAKALGELIGNIAVRTRTRVWIAQDEPKSLAPADALMATDYEVLQGRVEDATFVGGMDNAPALAAAWDWLEGKPDALLLWIHGPQGLDLDSDEALAQRIERSTAPPRWMALQLAEGPNRLLQALAPQGHIDSLHGDAGLHRIEARLSGRGVWTLERRRVGETTRASRTDAPASGGPAAQGSSHILRLWARDVIDHDREVVDLDKTRLGVSQRLITHLTGAVVLETQAQYDRHDLEPGDPTHVPSIPEPSLVLLAMAAALVIGVELLRRRKIAWRA